MTLCSSLFLKSRGCKAANLHLYYGFGRDISSIGEMHDSNFVCDCGRSFHLRSRCRRFTRGPDCSVARGSSRRRHVRKRHACVVSLGSLRLGLAPLGWSQLVLLASPPLRMEIAKLLSLRRGATAARRAGSFELAPRQVIGAAYLFLAASHQSTGVYSAGRATIFAPAARPHFPEVDFAQSHRPILSHARRG